MTSQTAHEHIQRRLIRLRTREAVFSALFGLPLALAIALGGGLLLVLLEAAFYLSPTLKIALGSLLALAAIGLFIRYGLYPWLAPPDLDALALRVETHFGGLQQQLISALQLWRDRDRPGQSTALIDAAVLNAEQVATALDFNAIINRTRPVRTSGIALFFALLSLSFYGLWPQALGGAAARLSQPLIAFERPLETHIALRPGHAEIIAGEPFEIAARLSGVVPANARLFVRESGVDIWTPLVLPVRRNAIAHRFPSVTRSFTYRLRAHDAETPPFELTVRPRPMISRITRHDRFPPHTGLPDRRNQEGGDIVVPEGTAVSLHIEASHALSEAHLSFDDGARLPAHIDQTNATAEFVVQRDARYTVGLRDHHMIANRDPVEYRIVALPDRPPDVRLLRPRADAELGEAMRADLLVEAFDDYGIARLELRYRLDDDERDRVEPIPIQAGLHDIAAAYAWDLSGFDLLPGDRVSYRVRAYDNNPTPGIGETATYTLRFPSLYEIHQAAEREQRESLEQMADVRDQSEHLRERLESVRRDLMRSEEMDWQKKRELEGAVQTQQDLSKKLDAATEHMEKTLERLEQSGLLQDETLEKLQEIQNLMSQIQTPELQKALEKLQEAMQSADPTQVREALEAFQMERDKFQQALDRTIALLQRVQQEQTLDALNRKLESLAQAQEQVATELNRDTPLDDLARREAQIARDAEKFQQDLERAAGQMPEPTAQQLGDLSDAMQQRNMTDRMNQVQRDLSAGKRDPARSESQTLSQDLQAMSEQLQQARSQFLNNQKTQIARELKRVLHDLLALSRAQEQTAQKADGAQTREESAPLAREQARTLTGANRMASRILDAAQQSLFVPPQTEAALGKALQNMEGAIGNLNDGNNRRAAQQAREAMGDLNAAAMMVQNALGQIAASSSGTGFDEMMQQMSQLSEQQGGLNEQTQDMFGQPKPGQNGQPGWEQLAAQQQAIQQAMDQLRQELARQRQQALGDLGKIANDMEETARELRNRQVTPETLDRQRDILTRMLDAQRSMRQRGQSRQREAQTARNTAYRGPGSLPSDLGEADNPLRRRLRDALGEGYSTEYQALIRRYFETLMQDASKPADTP